MYRPLGFLALVFLILAALSFFVAGAEVTVSTLTATREIAWGLFCGTVGLICALSGSLYVPLART